MKKLLVASVIVILVATMAWLGGRSRGAFAHESLMDQLRLAEGGALRPEQIFDTASFVQVHADIEALRPFLTPRRTVSITSFPCQHCHTLPVEQMGFPGDTTRRKAHWDIHLHHAGSAVMDCFTCHSQSDPNKLRSLSGQLMEFDGSHELCGQCHTHQYKDWLGGAHGKKLSGWNEPRVSQTCVGCHNPHKPALESRWPSRWTGH